MKHIFLVLLIIFSSKYSLSSELIDQDKIEPEEGYDFILDYKVEETEAYKTIMKDYEWDLNHLKISGDLYENAMLKYHLDKMSTNDPFPVEETFVR